MNARNLRHRSFRGQDLTRADFSQADLRGCDFYGANLTAANFQGARCGRSPRQWIWLISLTSATVLIVGNAVWRLLFSALGQPLVGTSGILVIVLHLVLSLVGGASWGLPRSPQRAIQLGGSCSGLLVGFFYGGSWFDNTLPPAVIGAAIVGGLSGWGLRHPRSPLNLVALTANWIATSAVVFLLGVTSLAAWMGQPGVGLGAGLGFSSLTALFVWCTWRWGVAWEAALHGWGGTSFRQTTLTQANFAQAHLGHVDWSGAISPPAGAELD